MAYICTQTAIGMFGSSVRLICSLFEWPQNAVVLPLHCCKTNAFGFEASCFVAFWTFGRAFNWNICCCQFTHSLFNSAHNSGLSIHIRSMAQFSQHLKPSPHANTTFQLISAIILFISHIFAIRFQICRPHQCAKFCENFCPTISLHIQLCWTEPKNLATRTLRSRFWNPQNADNVNLFHAISTEFCNARKMVSLYKHISILVKHCALGSEWG